MAKKGGESENDEILNTLADFTSKENWDKFFSIRGSGDSFEWYAEWSNLRESLLSQLSSCAASADETLVVVSNDSSMKKKKKEASSASLQILVPGCGNSRLSEHVYDAGFRSITNIDFSKVVISDMLRRNIRARPDMKWRVMDMTHMQFTDSSFDAVLDKGGLDALMEPELGSKLGSQYLSEVKRVLKSRGKFVCLTLAESHVLGLLFSKFRFGWKISLLAIPHKPSKKAGFRTFMMIAEKDGTAVPYQITSSFDHHSLDCDGDQGRGLCQALEAENKLRSECSSGADILYSLEDLKLGAKGDLDELILGRRILLTLGEEGDSRFSYKAVLLDAKQQSDPFLYHCGVFLVPKIRSHDWLFSSEEGQWLVVESSKAARLIMVFLDARHAHATMDDIQKDLSPLVKTLAPRKHDDGAQIPFMMASDGVKQRDIVHQVTSAMTGPVIVEDVVYDNTDSAGNSLTPSKDLTFRRLTFERSMGLVQSEALLTSEGCSKNILSDTERRKTNSSSKSKRKESQRKDSRSILNVDHNYLASSYHIGIISGFMLVVSKLESAVSSGRTMKTVIIGLGAGILPMFLRGCMPCLDIEVVELDSIVLNLARDYFSFTEDKQLKVHIVDGIKFVREFANVAASSSVSIKHESEQNLSVPNGNGSCSPAGGQESAKIDILIIDADSADSSSGMTCPPANFVEESFLLSVKDSLSEGGLFVINLVSRSQAIREMVVSRMKTVFSHLFCLQLEEDVNEILFALPVSISCVEDGFSEAALHLQKLLKFTHPERGQNILDTIKKIKCLK